MVTCKIEDYDCEYNYNTRCNKKGECKYKLKWRK